MYFANFWRRLVFEKIIGNEKALWNENTSLKCSLNSHLLFLEKITQNLNVKKLKFEQHIDDKDKGLL